MSSLIILRQPRAFQPKDGSFVHKPEFAWFVQALANGTQYEEFQEADVMLESLEFFGKDAWERLLESQLFDAERLEGFQSLVTLPDGSLSFYPVARLRSSKTPPLKLSLTHSPEELSYINNQLFEDLTVNHFKLSRQARTKLGSGDLQGSRYVGAPAVELLELELSDRSLLLGWGWVWYHA